MSLVNIPRYCEDPNYRYKMPRIQSRIEGRGNGTKTNISNMGDIARALKRPPTYATKFFGCELGAMSKFEEAEEKALINGAHNEKILTLILDKFIDKYVLCPNCHLPEIEVLVKKGILSCRCNACGHQGLLDMTHKAASYMAKNPATTNESSKQKSLDKKVRKKSSKKQDEERENGTQYESAPLEKLTLESPELIEASERLALFMASPKYSVPSDFGEELHMIQISQDFDNVCRFYVACSAIFHQGFSLEALENNVPLIKASCTYAMQPREILTAFCYFVVAKNPNTVSDLPYMCKCLYANDVLEGQDICKFFGKPSRFSGNLADAYLEAKKAADPFVQWLLEDDEE
ncbi:bifunctional W2 domain/Translation initiation factor IF2-IF5 domain/Translation initiation factor IF2-IF5 [Babesia duncani]|uniref:Bifunctional W2 domain/Translation initiation factor IF2-IF5 domain/Translation initiation factor IF2-IF5 n=1 Tax=Babesia duncani TaxID=323732 RepID=A0AAD9PJW8_9APIC|nr:bifunctional W2 domain/Translation initiation factor IF2-IF5 domain/Translation initiation factor IF2-IF5 [Babesia duncani]